MDLSNIVERYWMPKALSIHTEFTYQGQPISKEKYEAQPEIHHLYPSWQEIRNVHEQVSAEWKEGDKFTIEVSEKGINVSRR